MEIESKIESKIERRDRYGNVISNVTLRVPQSEYRQWIGVAKARAVTLTSLIRVAMAKLIEGKE